MSFPIGFHVKTPAQPTESASVKMPEPLPPKKSVVRIHFPSRNLTCSYYNDAFDLHCGDLVYVDGKLEGLRGRVVDVSYTFKIKLSDYHRVIYRVDTDVTGTLYLAGSHMVALDPAVLPAQKIRSWFLAPANSDEAYASGSDDKRFFLENLSSMDIDPVIAHRGEEYYMENRVVYLCVDGNRGYALVEGTQPYEVEFTYQKGEIGDLVCSCYCSYPCKHEFAVLLQLRETLKIIEESYGERHLQSQYFAAIPKGVLFAYAVDGKKAGQLTFGE